MKILVLNYEFPPVGGGGGKVCEDLCRGLARRGHQVRVQTAHFRGLPRQEDRDGFTVYRTWSMRRYAHTCSVFEMAAFLVTNLYPSLKHAFGWKPDIIHVQFAVPTGVLGWFVSKVSGRPYLLTAHLGDIPGGVPDQTDHLFRVVKPLTRPIWKDAGAVTVPSEHVRLLSLQSYDVEIHTVPNSINMQGIKRGPLAPHSPVRLVFAGRFNPQKNLLFLVDVLDRISDLDWTMDMLGDGPLMQSVKAKVNEKGLEQRVCFHGWVPSETVEDVMAESDILFMPSLSEGLPLVGARALGIGLAIVGSAVGGITDLVEDGVNGFVCPVDSADSFESRLRELISNPDLLPPMKSASQELAEKFDLDIIAERFEELFVRVLKDKHSPAEVAS